MEYRILSRYGISHFIHICDISVKMYRIMHLYRMMHFVILLYISYQKKLKRIFCTLPENNPYPQNRDKRKMLSLPLSLLETSFFTKKDH